MNKQLSRTSAPGASTAVQLMFLVWKWSRITLMVLEKRSVSKIWFLSLHFASRTVYRSLLYVLKVAMRAKSKRIQTTHDICKFYLHLYTNQQQMNNRSLAFPILLWTVQSEIYCVHHLFSVIYAFLFNVVRLLLVGIFERLAKTLQFLKKIHGDFFRSYSCISISSHRRRWQV